MSMSKTPEALLSRLEWTIIRRLDGLFQGEYRTLFRGSGMDLADLREYQPPDDVRHIDWNVTARLQAPYVRVFHEDREMTAWFLVDLSPSVEVGWAERRKRELVIEFTALIARLLSRRGNRVAGMLFGDSTGYVHPPGGGRDHVLHLIRRMTETPADQSGPTDLSVVLRQANRTILRRSAVFLVSDFLSVPGWERELGMLSRRNEVLACRVLDPNEREIPDIGIATIEDAETGERLTVDTHSRKFRHAFQKEVERQDEAIVDAFAASNVDALEVSTRDSLVETVLRFATLRRSQAALHG
jgi:uncharacterized protein (DUF58 family)